MLEGTGFEGISDILKFKKIIKGIMITVLCLAIVQCVRFSIEKWMLRGMSIEVQEGNCAQYVNECIDGNRVAVWERNGLSTFPFVFGNRLYLYDIEQDKKALLACTFLPFAEIGNHVLLTDNAVYYNKPAWNEVIGDYYRKDYQGKKIIDIYDLYLGYSVLDNKLYYEKVDTGSQEYDECGEFGDFCSDIYVMDMETGKEEKLIEGNIGYFKIIDGKMYCYELKEEKILIVDLESGDREEFPYQCVWMSGLSCSGDDRIYILDTVSEQEDFIHRIVKYDTENSKIVWEKQVVPKDFEEKIYLKNDEIYFLTEDNNICKITESGKNQEVVIDFCKEVDAFRKEEYKNNINISVNYCEDYIAIDLYYYSNNDVKGNTDLLIYDYEGNFIRKK